MPLIIDSIEYEDSVADPTVNGQVKQVNGRLKMKRGGVVVSVVDCCGKTVDPTVSDDGVSGYPVGSVWINLTSDYVFESVDATTGAAIWKKGVQGIGDLPSFTLATLNGKVSDATLIDTGDSRLSNDRTASGVRTASTVVSVSGATAPTSGQVLTATSGTNATWQTPSVGGITYTERWSSFTVGTSGSWVGGTLSGIGANKIVSVTAHSSSNNIEVGVRQYGGSLQRKMNVKADSPVTFITKTDGSSRVELFAGNKDFVTFYVQSELS